MQRSQRQNSQGVLNETPKPLALGQLKTITIAIPILQSQLSICNGNWTEFKNRNLESIKKFKTKTETKLSHEITRVSTF